MSKTAQRKRSAHKQGYNDAQSGYGYRWKAHPFLNAYDAGYRLGKAHLDGERQPSRGPSNKILLGFGGFLFTAFVALLIIAALGK